MPFKSKKQMRWMYANKPEMAKRWSAHTPEHKSLPESAESESEKTGNSLLDGPLKSISNLAKPAVKASALKMATSDDYQSDSSGQPVGPPHLTQSSMVGQNCAACKHFDKQGTCIKYNYPVQPTMTCDAFEEISLDVNKIENAGPVEPVKPIMPDTGAGGSMPSMGDMKFGAYKQARAARPDRYSEFEGILGRVSNDPRTISGSMVTPLKVWHESAGSSYESHMDKAKKNREEAEKTAMTTKEAFKAGFLLKCAEADMSLEQIEKHIDSLLEKKADLGSAAGWLTGMGLDVGKGLLGRASDIGLTGLVGGPILAGGLAGYGLGRYAGKQDPEGVKTEELRNEYSRLADEARRRAVLRRMQEQHPGSIVQIA